MIDREALLNLNLGKNKTIESFLLDGGELTRKKEERGICEQFKD
jgi:hypothetical protein